MVPSWLPKWPPIDIRVISLSSIFQPCGSLNGWDMDILKKIQDGNHGSKMAARMAAKMAANRYKSN